MADKTTESNKDKGKEKVQHYRVDKLAKWFNSLPWQERSLLVIGVALVFVTVTYLCLTTNSPIRLSTNSLIWKNDVEFIGLLFGPYIGTFGAYFVWKTLEVQAETKIVEGYLNIFARLEREFNAINSKLTKLNVLVIGGTLQGQDSYLDQNNLRLDVSNQIYIVLQQYFAIINFLKVNVKHRPNILLAKSGIGNFANQFIIILATNSVLVPEEDFRLSNHPRLLEHTMENVSKFIKMFKSQ